MLSTNTELDVFEDLDKVIQPAVEALVPIWLPNGMPMFIAEDKSVMERAIAEGWQVFYVLGIYKEIIDVTPKNAVKQQFKEGPAEPSIFKVVNNMVSKAIVRLTDDNLGQLEEYDDIAYFKMVPIPYDLIEMMDAFFRRVDDKLGTEAIVVLTYDTRYTDTVAPEDGWGLIVPKQTNSGGHCRYEPMTILDEIEDEDQEFIRIVGSAHSHPGMGAFASHTDHGDQLGNDGIHITFGWSKNGPTAFWIEMQVGEKNWTLTEQQAFGPRPDLPVTTEIEGWTSQVSKQVEVPKAGQSQTGYRGATNGQTNTGGSKGDSDWGDLSIAGMDEFGVHWKTEARNLQLPQGIPNPRSCVLFTNLITDTESDCPICDDYLLATDRERRACPKCHTFLALGGESTEEIRKQRALYHSPMSDPMIKRWNAATIRDVPVVEIVRFIHDTTGEIDYAVTYLSGDPAKKA